MMEILQWNSTLTSQLLRLMGPEVLAKQRRASLPLDQCLLRIDFAKVRHSLQSLPLTMVMVMAMVLAVVVVLLYLCQSGEFPSAIK
jgi:hypothetical protein